MQETRRNNMNKLDNIMKERYEKALTTINEEAFNRLFKFVEKRNRFCPQMYMFDTMGYSEDIDAFYARCSDDEIIGHIDLINFVNKNWEEPITYNLIWKEARRRKMAK